MRAEDVMQYVVEKLKELVQLIENFGGYLVDEVDKVFPPETRGSKLRHWLEVAAPLLVAGVILLLCICCCRRCCCGRRRVKMMKAPGRDYLMPRPDFEKDPRSYFRGLRASQIDELV